MSPVWCFFGGEGGAAVLGLLPMPKPIMIGDQPYHVVLGPFRAGAGRRMPGLCPGKINQASGFRSGGADEHLCVDGGDIAADGGLNPIACTWQ